MKKIACIMLILLLSIVSAAYADEMIVDNQYVTMTLKAIEQSGDNLDMKLLLENKTDKTVMFSVENSVVNGWACDPFWANEVAPGKKSNATVSWTNLSSKGVTSDVSVIELYLQAYDSNDWSADPYYKDNLNP